MLPFTTRDEMLRVMGILLLEGIIDGTAQKMADIKAGRRAPDKGAACNAKCNHG